MASLDPEVGFPVLNPNTPLAFLPPEAAAQTSIIRYVEAIVLGVVISIFWIFAVHMKPLTHETSRPGFGMSS